MPSITLKPGREKSVLRHHPWIFSGAIEKIEGTPGAGETVEVRATDGSRLAWGAYSPQSQIAVRLWSLDPEQPITPTFFRARLDRALAARRALGFDLSPQSASHNPLEARVPAGVSNIPHRDLRRADEHFQIGPESRVTAHSSLSAYRLVNAESDFLPGLIVDRYSDYLVCQFLSAGAEHWKPEIIQLLDELVPNAGIYERSDVDVRQKEGLFPATGVLSGDPPPDLIEIQENECRFAVDVQRGHKTGFYLDQRDNRALLADYSRDREVLNCFAYTGAFGVWALKGGAVKVTNIESAAGLLELAQRNLELNQLDSAKVEHVTGDVFHVLRHYRDSRRQFDLIVLDPPKFAESRSQVERAARGYKDINLLAFKLLRPGGVLFTFSCSGLIPPDLFQKIVADAALDAGREAQIVRRLTQSADHPVALNFPEGEYLKGLVCRVE